MRQSRAVKQIAQRADYYETGAGRNLHQRAAARIRALRDRDVVADGGTIADSGREMTGSRSAASAQPTSTSRCMQNRVAVAIRSDVLEPACDVQRVRDHS